MTVGQTPPVVRRIVNEGPNRVDSSTGISDIYRERRDRFGGERDALTIRWNRLANLRLAAFVLAVAFVIWAIGAGVWWPVVPAAILLVAFVILVIQHRQVGRARQRASILHDLNNEGDMRVRRAWRDLPLRHDFRPSSDHPFAGDLDIFGRASVFHLLETVETPMGKARLRSWLLSPAPVSEIVERQAAVAELAPLLDWRQTLGFLGRRSGEERPDPAQFLEWAEGEPLLSRRPFVVWAARVSVALLVITALLQAIGVLSVPIWPVFLVVNLIISQGLASGAAEPIATAAEQHRSLVSYASLLQHLDELSPQSPLLQRLRERLTTGGHPAHEQVRRLHRLTAWAVPRGSITYLPLQALVALDVHVLDALERWQRVSGPHVRDWLDALGDAEALAALASLTHDQPTWTFPEIDRSAPSFSAEAMGHPLLSDAVRVVNDVTVGPTGTVLLITGSNMSGKSTLLRSIGVNIVLAGAGAPVCARSLQMPLVSLWTSVRVQDSLEQGVSFFMAELLRLKLVVDAARDTKPDDPRLFYLLDEILQGTNTTERQIAARRIIRGLVDRGAIGAVSTHDLTLPEGPELSQVAQLVHFRDTVADTADGPTMGFDYHLRPGLATSTNALRLMELVGFDLPN